MKLSAEEKLMYQVMKAIYESGIPVSFKGSMVLKACLMEAGFTEDVRHTVDIDANWNTDNSPSADHMVESIQHALTKSGIDLKLHLYRMYGEGRSAGFELTEPVFLQAGVLTAAKWMLLQVQAVLSWKWTRFFL